MAHSETVTKDLQLKIRIDEADKRRLEDLAAHYSAPVATVVRMLAKEKHDAITALEPAYLDVMWRLSGTVHPTPLKTLAEALRRTVAWTSDALAILVERGLVQERKGGYTTTLAGEAKLRR